MATEKELALEPDLARCICMLSRTISGQENDNISVNRYGSRKHGICSKAW